MAFQSIDTGYKPEFGLGALYQGFNAANADQSAELELIKQFLANQREQQMQPIDVSQAQQNLTAGQYKTTPEYQTGMRDTISGQGMSNLAAGQTAAGLQPFKQKAEQAQLENELGKQQNLAKIQEIDNALNDVEATFQPGVRDKLLAARTSLINRFKETPEFAQKRELKETGTDSAEYIAELRAAAARKAAEDKANAPKPPKTGEEALVRYWQGELAAGNITQDQYEQEVAAIFNRRTEKPVQSGITGSVDAQGNIQLGNKPNVAPYAPRAGSVKQSDEDLINKYLSK